MFCVFINTRSNFVRLKIVEEKLLPERVAFYILKNINMNQQPGKVVIHVNLSFKMACRRICASLGKLVET